MNPIKFSITIPAYKGKYLSEAIESVLAQTYDNFELIIVDDCSPENLKSIVDQYNDSRVQYFRNEKNCGAIDVVDNWNICLSYCTGEYVICMGDDDRLLPDCLSEYKRLISEYPNIGLLHGWTEIINEKSETTNITAKRCPFETALSLTWHRWNVYKQQFIGDFCFNTDFLREKGGFYKLPLAWASDDITAVIAASKNGVVNTGVPVFQYRVSSCTITNSGNHVVKMDSIMLEEEWYLRYLMNDKNIVQTKEDILYHRLLKEQIFNHFLIKKEITIAQDIKFSKQHVFYWLKSRNKYNLRIKNIVRSFVKSFRIR